MDGGRACFVFICSVGARSLGSVAVVLKVWPSSDSIHQSRPGSEEQESRSGAGQNDESVQAGLSSVHRGGPDLFALFSERWLASKQACAFPERAYASPPLWH